jgi:hypothetical protein
MLIVIHIYIKHVPQKLRGTKLGTPKEPRPFQIKNKIEKQFTNENKETQKNITTSNIFEPERVKHKELPMMIRNISMKEL